MSEDRPDNLRLFPLITDKDIDPDVMLRLADGKLQGVVILGVDKNGDEFFSSSYADGGDVLWLLERARIDLMTMTGTTQGD